MIFLAVVVAYNLGLVERRKQALHTVSEHNPEEVADPIVVHMVAVEAVHKVVVQVEMEVAEPIAVRMEAEEVEAVRMEVVVAHTEVVVAVPDLAVAVDLDHKTWINPSCRVFIFFSLILTWRKAIPYYRCESKQSSSTGFYKCWIL